MSDEPLHDDFVEIDPKILPWIPLSLRAWIMPPLLLVAVGVIVLVAARGHTSTVIAHRLDLGWRAAAVGAIVAALIMAPFGRRAYVDVSERAALRYRRVTMVSIVGLGVLVVIAGALSGNAFLASVAINSLWPLAARARGAVMHGAAADPARSRRTATATVAVSLLAILVASFVLLLGPGGRATTIVVSNVSVYGTAVAIGAFVARRRIGRRRGPT